MGGVLPILPILPNLPILPILPILPTTSESSADWFACVGHNGQKKYQYKYKI